MKYMIQTFYDEEQEWKDGPFSQVFSKESAIEMFNQIQWIEPHFGYRILEFGDSGLLINIGKSDYPNVKWEKQ